MSSDPDKPDMYATDKGYALSGKIMLSAIVILFFVVILMVCLHLYARWYLLNVRRRHLRRSRNHRRTHLVLSVDPANPNPVASNRGLDASVLKSLPVFVYSTRTHANSLDCAVCLAEFEENEKGRVLPKCNHSFHIECIDMWFHSHSTCPLCRSPIEPSAGDEPQNPSHLVMPVIEPGSSSELCATCGDEEGSAGTSSFGDRRKPRELVGVSIEVPPRNYNQGFENELAGLGCDSPSSQNQSQSSFRSPVSRMLSFKRILSRERRGNSSPSTAGCAGVVTEIDIERGRE